MSYIHSLEMYNLVVIIFSSTNNTNLTSLDGVVWNLSNIIIIILMNLPQQNLMFNATKLNTVKP